MAGVVPSTLLAPYTSAISRMEINTEWKDYVYQ